MKNASQLKAIIKNIAKKKNIPAMLVLQNYMLERFLERVALSPYRNNFIIKGGFLIASMVGLDSRATMDMDATIKGYPVNAHSIQRMIEDIISVPINDGITIRFKRISEIRESDEYDGYRVSLSADYETIAVPLKLDITTGDKITPCEIEYSYKMMLENRSINVLAYNLSTLLAEKLETVVSRGDQNTRLRDYYDIFILSKFLEESIDLNSLSEALLATATRRGSLEIMKQYRQIITVVKNSAIMQRQWSDYQSSFDYALGIKFGQTCNTVVAIMDSLSGLDY